MAKVSKPVNVEVEIEDLVTRCTYIYEGASVSDCVNYFKSLFFGNRPYRVLWTRQVNKTI